jgi:hypothetical protein
VAAPGRARYRGPVGLIESIPLRWRRIGLAVVAVVTLVLLTLLAHRL